MQALVFQHINEKEGFMNKITAYVSTAIAVGATLSTTNAFSATIAQTFTENYQCNDTVTLKAQTGISQQQLIQSCNEIAETDQIFHNFFSTTPDTPLPNDNNDTLDVYIYLSSAEYKAKAGDHFDISTNNGGIYLEGDPTDVNNQAVFIAHICEDSWIPFSCSYQGQVYNLQHEYVHYLDGRFNVSGPFGTFNYNAGLAEGLADFLAHGEDYTRTLEGVDKLDIPPFYNILTADYSHPDLYKWGYLAMHYVSNLHRAEYDLILDALRSGNTTNFRSTAKAVATRIGGGFDNYVTSISSALPIVEGDLPADNTFGSCDLEHKYVRYVDDPSTSNISVTNYTEVPLRLMWISNISGEAGTSEITRLTQGEEYNNNFWRNNDRFMMMSDNRECVGVGVIGETSRFEIDAPMVANVVPDQLPPANEVGSCDLARPYFRATTSADATITNNSNDTIQLRWVSHLTGQRSDTVYATLTSGQSYNASSWTTGDRMIFVDSTNNCKGVAVFNEGSNTFAINGDLPDNQAPKAVANGPYTGSTSTPITFSSSGSTDADGQIVDFLWTFGDGTTSTQANPTHTYFAENTFNVTLTVTDDSGLNNTVTTTAIISNDDDGSTTPVPNVCSSQPSITSGRLTNGEAACLGNSSAIWLSIADVSSHSSITIRTAHGSGDLNLDYSNSGWPNGANSHGSSDNSGNNECIHVTGADQYWGYIKVGGSNGSASILVEFDGTGCSSTSNNTAPVAVVNGPYSGFTNSAVIFSSQGSVDNEGPILSYHWDFGDNSTSNLSDPSHTYSSAGTYSVTLTVTDNDGATTTSSTTATISNSPTGGDNVANACASESASSGWIEVNDDICIPVGNWNNAISYYGFEIPAGTTSITISADHGSGDGNLYYQASNWANESSYNASSENPGNSESITITSPAAGYHYFSIVGAQSGMAVKVNLQ